MQTSVHPAAAPSLPAPPRNLGRELTLADLQAELAGIEARHAADVAAARARIAAGESPFAVHRHKILGGHSTALRLQALVLNLYNGGVWRKKVPAPLDDLIANADRSHFEAALDLLRGYYDSREEDREFLALGRQLAEERQPRARRTA